MKKKGFFLKNGEAVLEQLILSFNGKCNLIRTFSAEQLEMATDNFNWSRMIYQGSGYRMYKGVHEDHEISIKIFESTSSFVTLKFISNEVAIASRMSSHKNVLKLLGCCLETELPMLVYEFPVKGNVSSYFERGGNEQLPFEIKLRIAIGIANAVAYLHHGLSKTFIFQDLNHQHMFLDQDYGAKLSEFKLSIPIPEGETHVDAEIFGTKGFCAPEVGMFGRYTEKSDVYDFGILLCELFLGKRFGQLTWGLSSCKEGSSDSEKESGDSWDDLTEFWKVHLNVQENGAQKNEWAKLAESCLKRNPDDRPNMIEVAKALILVKSIRS